MGVNGRFVDESQQMASFDIVCVVMTTSSYTIYKQLFINGDLFRLFV